VWEKEHKVAELIDQWLAPTHRYFKVKDETGDIFILRHDPTSFAWELTMYLAARASECSSQIRPQNLRNQSD